MSKTRQVISGGAEVDWISMFSYGYIGTVIISIYIYICIYIYMYIYIYIWVCVCVSFNICDVLLLLYYVFVSFLKLGYMIIWISTNQNRKARKNWLGGTANSPNPGLLFFHAPSWAATRTVTRLPCSGPQPQFLKRWGKQCDPVVKMRVKILLLRQMDTE